MHDQTSRTSRGTLLENGDAGVAAGGPLGRRVAYAVEAFEAVARQPAEGLERVSERIAERLDLRKPLPRYVIDDAWERRFHASLGFEWPCPTAEAFAPMWSSVIDELRGQSLSIGRGAFGGWDDADPAFARAAWCLTLHLRPSQIVETGVARGLTTRVMLEALDRIGTGRLWSIDLPPLIERDLANETAAAVPPSLRERWNFVRGSSRRRLPQLLDRLGRIELFVHDSMHTTRNVLFELEHASRALAAGGAILVDDVERNAGVHRFCATTGQPAVIGRSDDGVSLIAVLPKTA